MNPAALALLLAPLAAQEPEILQPDQVQITTYKPQDLDLQSLYETVYNLAGRTIRFSDRSVDNLSLLYDRILIYDTQDHAQRILRLLATLEQDFGQEAEPEAQEGLGIADFPARDYRLRAMSASAARELLGAYAREVEVCLDGQNWSRFSTVTEVDGSTLLLRDTESNLGSMLGLLEKLDRPAPQLMIRCWVVRSLGAEEDAADMPKIPAPLERSLQEMLPGYAWTAEGQGGVRVASGSREPIELSMHSIYGAAYQLELEIDAYDAAGQALTLSQCSLIAQGEQLFRTSTSIAAQEYAVIGIAGGDPLLLVLQLLPIGG